MKILVTFALENEFAPWRKMRNFRAGNWGVAEARFAEIGGAQVGVVLTGIGPRQAAMVTSQILRSDHESLEVCISSGLAGGLRPAYQIGQVLAAETVFSENPRNDGENRLLQSSAALISFARENGAKVVEQFYTANHVFAGAEEKRRVGVKADAVEMESYEILRAAEEFGIPAIAIRAVSDTAGEDLPLDMSEVLTDEGQVSIPRVLGRVARHPQSLPGLLRLGQNSKRAAETLAEFLDRYVAAVAVKTMTMQPIVSVAGN